MQKFSDGFKLIWDGANRANGIPESEKCRYCKGFGVVVRGEAVVLCEKCKGSGRGSYTPTVCDVCECGTHPDNFRRVCPCCFEKAKKERDIALDKLRTPNKEG